jgi:hypothetical protein
MCMQTIVSARRLLHIIAHANSGVMTHTCRHDIASRLRQPYHTIYRITRRSQQPNYLPGSRQRYAFENLDFEAIRQFISQDWTTRRMGINI